MYVEVCQNGQSCDCPFCVSPHFVLALELHVKSTATGGNVKSLAVESWSHLPQRYLKYLEVLQAIVQCFIDACTGASPCRKAADLSSVEHGGFTSRKVSMRCSLQSILEYNKAISSCAKSTEWQAALQLFADLDLKGFQATVVTYNSAINACAQAANWRSAMLLLKNLDGTGLQANIISYSTAITSCEKAGQWQVAVVLLEDLKLKRLQLNIIAFNAVITACAKGCLHDSLGLVNLVIECY